MSLGGLPAIRTRARFLLVLMAASLSGLLASVAITSLSADAQVSGPPSITTIVSSTDYKTVTLTFSEAVYTTYGDEAGSTATPPPQVASGALTASDFTVSSSTGATLPGFTVTQDGSTLTSWKLNFASPIDPNETSIGVPANAIYDAEGGSLVLAGSLPVPLNEGELGELLSGFKATELPMDFVFDNNTPSDESDDYKVSNLPFIGEYFANDATVSSIVDGLSGVTTTTTQAGLEAALEGLDGVDAITFDASGMDVDLTPDTTPSNTAMSGNIGIDAVGLTVGSIDTQGAVTLDGSLSLDATGSGAIVDTSDDATDVTVNVDVSKTLSNLGADLGFAEAKIDSSVLSYQPAVALDLGCETGTSCAPTALIAGEPTLSGTGSWDLDSVSVTHGGGTTTFAPTQGVLDVDFEINNDFDEQVGPNLSLDTSSFDAIGLDGFNRVSMTSVLSGLGWLSTWLSEIEDHGAMGNELPLIGGSVGELSQISGELAETVAGLSDDIVAYSTEDSDSDGEADHPNISAQQAVELLCEAGLTSSTACADLLTPLELVVESGELKGIEYGIAVDLEHEFFNSTNSPVLNLGVQDSPLEGMSVNMEPGGWDGSADASFAFTLGIKTGTNDDLETELGLDPAIDYDGDGVGNAADWDADGDGLDDEAGDGLTETTNTPAENEGTDRDDDADGRPEDYSLAEGDLCRGIFNVFNSTLASPGISLETFAKANGAWVTDTDLETVGNQGGVDADACDALAKTTASVKTAVGGAGTSPTAVQVCTAGAEVHGVPVGQFRTLNVFSDDSACASALGAATQTTTFDYDGGGKAFGSPITIGHRVYVDTGELASVGLDVTAQGLSVSANLGFLDLAITSNDTIDDLYGVKFDPTFDVDLVDPGTGASDSKIDLMEMAEAADTGTMADLVSFDVSGQAEAHFDLANGILTTKQLDVVGDFTALDNPFTGTTDEEKEVFNFVSGRIDDDQDSDFVADRINIGHNLGDYLNLKDLTAADVIQIIVNLTDKVTQMAGDEVLATEVPFTGTTLADAVQFSRTFADMAAGIQAADPQSLSAFEDALSSALRAAGMPGDITPHVTGESLSFSFDASREVSAVYPFSLDPTDYGIPEGIPLLPSDGGASVAMTAGMEFTPELGILYDGTGISDRIYVKNFIPKFTASLDATVNGTINIGPFATSMNGELVVADPGDDGTLGNSDDEPAAITLAMTDPTTSTEMTLADLQNVLSDLEANSSLTIEGEFDASLRVAQPPGSLWASGSLEDLFERDFSAIDADADIDFSKITLTLDSFVTGATQTARWIGSLMEQSQSYSAEIPLVGDELTKIANVGKAMNEMADTVDSAWSTANEDAETFKNQIETKMETAIAGAFSGLPEGALEVDAEAIWTEADGSYDLAAPITSFGGAGGLVVKLHLALKDDKTISLGGGLDVPPVLELDANISPTVTYGFTVDLGLGVSIEDGFYVVGDDDGDLLDVFAKLNTSINLNKVKVAGAEIAKIENGSAVIGGDIGPGNTNAAGFEVEIVRAPGTPNDSTPQISLADIVGKKKRADKPVNARFSINSTMDLPLKTAFPKIPNLSLPIHFKWNAAGSVSGGAQIGKPSLSLGSGNDAGDDQIELDAKELLKEVIAPALTTANDYNPFAKVPMIKNTIDSNIPVLESSMRKIAKQFMGDHPAWTMFEFLLDLDQVATDVTTAANSLDGGIKLGWVEVTGDANGDEISGSGRHPYPVAWYDQAGFGPLVTALEGLIGSAGGGGKLKRPTNTTLPSVPSGGGNTVSTADMNTTNPVTPVTEQPTSGTGPCPTTAKPPAPTGATSSPKVGRNIGRFGCLFSFPIMDDPMAAIGMVLKGDFSETVSFFEFRPPPINVGPSIAWQRTLFDLNTGIIDGSLTVGFDGALGLTVRLGFGFDSSGLVKGRFPLDGFYLIDFKDPDTGRDLNEVDVGGRVAGFIDGRFSIFGGIGSASFNGAAGVNATAGLDFNDESEAIPAEDRNDGRYHFREIAQVALAGWNSSTDSATQVLRAALCPMRPTADLSAFLSIRGKAKALGITVFDESFSDSWDLLDILGVPKTINCPPPDRIAQAKDGQLVLNGGPNAPDRLNGASDIAEGFNITQSGQDITVSWTGTGSMSPSSLTFNIDDNSITEIVGDLGTGNDSVSIAHGVTIPARINGGPGNDNLSGGGQDDEFDGGPGSDILNGGGGDDTLLGGTGNDTLTGGTGDDDLQGGDSSTESSNDTYNFSGTWGNDVVEDPDGEEKFVFTTSAALTGTSEFADALITDGTNSVAYFVDEIDEIQSGSGDDDFTIKSQVPDGFLLNGNGGADEIHVEYMGQERTIEIKGGAGTGDVFHALGTPGPDLFLSRANSAATDTQATAGSLYMLADQFPEDEPYNPDDDLADEVMYDNSFEELYIETLDDQDHVVMDDNAAPTQIDGGEGSDRFQVGQIYGDPSNDVVTEETTRGHLSKGVGYDTTINGNYENSDVPADPDTPYVAPTTYSDDDYFQVYANKAELDLNGNEGDDTFVVRAFALADGVEENATTIGEDVDLGGGVGVDHFEYVQNELVNVDGGRGFDTFVIVGTEFSDGFLVSDDGVKVCQIAEFDGQALPDPGDCGLNTTYVNIEKVVGQGLEGSDVFQVLSTTDEAITSLFGGEDGDRFIVGDDGKVFDTDADGKDVGILGPLTLRGESDPGFDSTIAKPIVLPGESTDGFTSQCSDGEDNDDDGDTDYPDDEQCYGDDDPREGTSLTQDDNMLVDASSHTVDDTGAIDFDLASGDPTGAVTGLGMWAGGELSSTANSGQSHSFPAGVIYGDMEFAVVELGSGDDTFDVDSTHEGTTTVRAGDGDDEINVKTVAGITQVRAEAGDDTVNAGGDTGEADGRVEGLGALLDVYGNDGDDEMYVDDTNETNAQTVGSDQISEAPPGVTTPYTRGQLLGIGMSVDGIKYDTLELVDVGLGDDDDFVDVRGTTTDTVFHGNDGDEHFYVSSDAAISKHGTEFLTGDLDDVDGEVWFDAGTGRHRLMVSDEASSTGDGTATARVSIDEDEIKGLSTGDINYDTDAVTTTAVGTYADGITVWTSKGADFISWTGSRRDTDVRTATSVNTNAGADDVVVDLAAADGDSVLNTEGGSDTVDASSSSLGLLVFGGPGIDVIETGSGADVILGDTGLITYSDGTNSTTIHGNGSATGDKTDGVERTIATIASTGTGDNAADGDTIVAGAGNDKVIAGNGADQVEGGTGDDDITGDAATFTAGATSLKWTSQRSGISTSGGQDVLAGDEDDDWILGQHGNDRIMGGALIDADDMDVANTADDGDDIMIGDHDVALGLAGQDTFAGDNGDDMIFGDNAQHERGTSIKLLDVQLESVEALTLLGLSSTVTVPATAYGEDIVYGNDNDDRIYGQGGDDTIDGGADDDYIEGNHGEDTVFGGPDNDDIIGGGSSNSGVISATSQAAGLLDETDHLFGDDSDSGAAASTDGHDVILGDNGHIERDGSVLDEDLYPDHPMRVVEMADRLPGPTSAGDEIRGNGGNDELYGQLDAHGDADEDALEAGCNTALDTNGDEYIVTVTTSGDVLCGDAGQDALIGDLGVVTVHTSESQEGSNASIISSSPFIDETILKDGDLFYSTVLDTPGTGGDDLIFGGSERDSIHSGQSDDLVNGDAGDDAIFGGLGDDDLWGGEGHDRIYGGHGADDIDVKPNETATTGKNPAEASPAVWFLVAPEVDHDGDATTTNNGDFIYGGWDADIMQADVGDAGTVAGDRLVDWSGSFNLFYVCNGAYGAGRVQREFSPAFSMNLQQLAAADGSTSIDALGPTGQDELGLVSNTYVKDNTKPKHPLWPGNFTCEA